MFRAACFAGLTIFVVGCGHSSAEWTIAAQATAAEPVTSTPVTSLESLTLPATTMPTPGRISEVAATVMHPVTKIFVKPGDMVRAGQSLIEMDSDEPEAEVRAKQAEVKELTATVAKLRAMPRTEERAKARAELESAQIEARAAAAYLERLKSLRAHEAISERQLIEQQTTTLRTAANEQAAQAQLDYLLRQPIEHEIAEAESALHKAKAELEAAEAELEHYVVYASIDGMICWLDVTVGTVSRAGTKVWGEVVDLREVDVQVELTAKQLSQVDLTQSVMVRLGEVDKSWPAKFVFASPAANRTTGRIPVTLRVSNTGEPLRCHLNVTAEFKLAVKQPAKSEPAEILAAQ